MDKKLFYWLGGASYQTNVQSWLTQGIADGGTPPSAAILNALSTFMSSLDTFGIGPSSSDMLSCNIMHTGSKEFVKLNIKNVAQYKYTESGTVSFSEGNGCKSASSSYFNQPLKSNEFAGIESSFTFINYVSESETTDANTAPSGVRTGTPAFEYMLLWPKSAGRVFTWLHGTQSNQTASGNHKGLFIVTNTPTDNVLYRDGVKTSVAKVPVAPTVQRNRLVLAYNDGTTTDGVTATGHYTRYVAIDATYRIAFDDTKAANFKTAFDAYKTAVSLP